MTDLRERLVKIDEPGRTSPISQSGVGLQEILSNKQARGAFGQIS